ncbi:MAG: 2-keto-3-deoxygluconate permease [Desulfitobacterium hafniense]|nr:2-keto-3-deoxygluconate permease [Desulfitobacterium hafniense]
MDEDIRDLCEKGTPLIIPFNGFVLGATLNLGDILKAGYSRYYFRSCFSIRHRLLLLLGFQLVL